MVGCRTKLRLACRARTPTNRSEGQAAERMNEKRLALAKVEFVFPFHGLDASPFKF
jgi:hypothetical protein